MDVSRLCIRKPRIVFLKLWGANTLSIVLDFQSKQNMTIRTKIIQWNESRTSCSPYNTYFWLPCICSKKSCIIGKTERIPLHLLSLVFNASQYFGMEESNVNFEFSLKLQFQGYYFHTSDVVNITVTEQNKNVTEEFRIMLGRT